MLQHRLRLQQKFQSKFDAFCFNFNKDFINIFRPTFRNYKGDKKSVAEISLPNVENLISDQLEEMQSPLEVHDIDLANLAPRKVDFDLKRAINKKLLKLEKRTQKAISELIRERLRSDSKKQEELLEQVNLGAEQSQHQNVDEDSD